MRGLSPHDSGSLGVGECRNGWALPAVITEPGGVHLHGEAGQANLPVTASKAKMSLLSRTFLPQATCLPILQVKE